MDLVSHQAKDPTREISQVWIILLLAHHLLLPISIRKAHFGGEVHCANSVSEEQELSYPVVPIANQSQLLLYLPDVTRCFCNFCPLQVPFCQELLNVLLLLLQGLLEGCGARNFSCIPGRGFCQLHKINVLKIIVHQEKENRGCSWYLQTPQTQG